MTKNIPHKLIHYEKVVSILNKISLFGGLNDSQLYSLFNKLETINYSEDEYIFKQGDSPSHIYIILEGEVKIILQENETNLELATFSIGNCLGETSVIGIQPHTASAITTKPTELLILSRGALMNIFHDNKELFSLIILNIAREACRRLGRSDNTILHYFCRKPKKE